MKLGVRIGNLRLLIDLLETQTAKALIKALPFESRAQTLGDERPKLASRCNVLGKIVGDPRKLAAVKSGEKITLEQL
jgi:hypothetical protein